MWKREPLALVDRRRERHHHGELPTGDLFVETDLKRRRNLYVDVQMHSRIRKNDLQDLLHFGDVVKLDL